MEKALSREQLKSRERTLMTAVLLSMWAPLVTGLAVIASHSTTQVADFLRRTVELIALIVSWQVFRLTTRNPDINGEKKARYEKAASLTVAIAMSCSGLVMAGLALFRLRGFEPGGNVLPGLTIAILGLITNSWFWRRYTRMVREQHNSILEAQRRLYRAKAFVDLCVISALASIAVFTTHPATRVVDILGSLAVAFYLLWSGLRTVQQINPDRETAP